MIVSGGILAQMLYNLLSSILRALGNSKLPLLFLVISALLNIVLDLVFIVGFGMGAKGAAVATVIAQGVSGILCLFYIIAKIPILHLKREDLDVGSTIYQNQLQYRSADGTSVFDHSNWNHDGTVFPEYSWFYSGCLLIRQLVRSSRL